MIKAKVAFIGAGIMGAGMAANLLRAGYELAVYNRTAGKVQTLLDGGASRASSPAQAVEGADFIVAITGDDASSREIWLGPDGVLSGNLKPGAIAIESTTLSLAWVQELSQALSNAGLRYIDCPVTGGRKGAESGTLTLLVGADDETLADARPMMNTYSRKIVHFGPVGTGTMYKLIVNLMVAAQAAALAEGILLAEQAGLDMDLVIQSLADGAVASRVVKAYAPMMARGDHEPVSFSLRWLHKDATYALQLASSMGQPTPTSTAAAQLYEMAAAGWAEHNASAVVEVLRQERIEQI